MKKTSIIIGLAVHCLTVVLQLWVNSYSHLMMKAVRLTLFLCLQFIRAKLCGWL